MSYIKWSDAQKKLNEKKVTYLWFGTDWCGDCQMMKPIAAEVIEEFKDNHNIQFIEVDAEEAKLFRVESRYDVKKIPTHVFLLNGEIKNILYEYVPKEILISEINKLNND